MRTHVKAMTYKPKIPDVLSGICRQTIRPIGKYPIKEGDRILFHGWEGKPRHSPWSWRLLVEVIGVKDVLIRHDGINLNPNVISIFPRNTMWDNLFTPWEQLDYLARDNGIKPPTGKALGALFTSMYDLRKSKPFQIISFLPYQPSIWSAIESLKIIEKYK